MKIDKSKKDEKSYNVGGYLVKKSETSQPSKFKTTNKVFKKEKQMEQRVSKFDPIIGITGTARANALPSLTEVKEPKSQPFFPAKQPVKIQNVAIPTQNIGSISIPTNATGTINVSQSGVFSAKSIPSKRSSNAGGGSGGGNGGGGGDSGRGFGGGSDKKPKMPKPKQQRKKERQAVGGKQTTIVRAKVKAPQKQMGGSVRTSTKRPKRDITKMTTPKPTGKVKRATGTIDKRVGGGKVRATETTKPQAKSRIRGENTTTYGSKGKMRGERTTI